MTEVPSLVYNLRRHVNFFLLQYWASGRNISRRALLFRINLGPTLIRPSQQEWREVVSRPARPGRWYCLCLNYFVQATCAGSPPKVSPFDTRNSSVEIGERYRLNHAIDELYHSFYLVQSPRNPFDFFPKFLIQIAQVTKLLQKYCRNLTLWVGCNTVTDRQTDRADLRRHKANVT